MIHELCWSKNDVWGRLLILAATILILDSPVHVVLMSVFMHTMFKRRWVQVIYRWICKWVKFSSSTSECDSWQICRMVWCIFQLCQIVCDVLQFYWWFDYYMFNIAWPCFPSGLNFQCAGNVHHALNTDNSVSHVSIFESHFPGCIFLK